MFNTPLFYALFSVLIVSLVSLIGVVTLIFRRHNLKGFLLFMISFAAGALLGDVFLHLLPELIEEAEFGLSTGLYILAGIVFFFILEKMLHWRHCHMAGIDQHTHPMGIINLVGGALHNMVDGALIAASYALSINVGIATTIAVILHEVPQEMGDFGVLLHSGMKVKKALIFNFASELVAFIGVFLILGLGMSHETIAGKIVPLTIGGFLYIANTDLIPELHKDLKPANSLMQLFGMLLGIGIMTSLLLLE